MSRGLVVILALWPFLGSVSPLNAADRPNIVLILADDMGFDLVSANNPAIGPLKTPHIDRLAAEGMNFRDAHSGSAVCTPTRYGLLTGRYCWRTRLKHSVLWTYGRPLLEPDRLTVAKLLQQQGYKTAIFGKWHLGLNWYDQDGKLANGHLEDLDSSHGSGKGAQRIADLHHTIDFSKSVDGGPLQHGFDHWFGVDVPNFPPYGWMVDGQLQGVPREMKQDAMFGAPGPMVPGWKLENILPTLGDRAAAWIEEQAKSDNPFFAYVPLTSPHTPIAPSPAFQGKSGLSTYADFVMETDAVIGRIIKAVDESGAADNTLVILTCDNGTATFARFQQLKAMGVDLKYHFKGHKAQIHEGGHRVPLIVRWPGHVPAGAQCQQTVCLTDMMATVADVLDVELSAETAEDSFSLLPLLSGTDNARIERPPVIHHDLGGQFAIRMDQWKLVEGKEPSLFDLQSDPKEAHNLADSHPERVEQLLDELNRIRDAGRSRP